MLDLVTPELREKLLPLNRKLQDIDKARDERRKTRRKTKAKQQEDAAVAAVTNNATTSAVPLAGGDVQMADAATTAVATPSSQPAPGVLEDEAVVRARENEELRALIDPSVAADIGASPHGLYELTGTCRWLTIISLMRLLS